MPVMHELGSSEEVLIGMYNSWRKVFRQFSTPIARFLLEWGFLTAETVDGKLKLNPKKLARYVSAAASASLASILEVRQEIEKEKVDARS